MTLAAILRNKLASKPVFGTFLKLGRREVVEILARAGLDFVICDLEHAQISEQEAGMVILAGLHCGLPVIVRVPEFNAGLINRLLEAGAAGIQLPQVRTRHDVESFRNAMKYPPEGQRSISLAQPAANYGGEPLADYIQRANEESLLVGQLESSQLEPLEQLVRDLDVAFIGTLDLSVDMGKPLDHPEVQQRLREIERTANAANVHLGIYADSPARASQAAAAGYRYIAISSDLGALSGAAKSWITQLLQGKTQN